MKTLPTDPSRPAAARHGLPLLMAPAPHRLTRLTRLAQRVRRYLSGGRLAALGLCLLLGMDGVAQAATYLVTSLDGGAGTCTGTDCSTIRAALAAANATPDDDVIEFAESVAGDSVIGATLVVPEAATGGALTVRGRLDEDGPPAIRLSGGGARRVLMIDSGANVAIEALGIVNGRANGPGSSSYGGGIYNNGGTLILTHSRLLGNGAGYGGGIFNNGTLTLTHSTLSGNFSTGFGGGILNEGTLILAHSTLSGNSADWGGGIYNPGTLTLAHSTLSGNSADMGGGGIRSFGTTTLIASVIANSPSGGDCVRPGGTIHAAHSLIQDGLECVNGPGSTDNLTGDPQLGDLADNGGPTQTHLPLPGSPLLDHVPCVSAPDFTDQRGVMRPQGADCDIGAVERADADDWIFADSFEPES